MCTDPVPNIQDMLIAAIEADDEGDAVRGIDLALTDGATFSGEGVTPLLTAVMLQKALVLRHLLIRGATLAAEWPNVANGGPSDVHGTTALHAAADHGDEAALIALLQADGRSFLEKFDDTGRTALIIAAQRGDAAICKALLDAGADVNACDEFMAGDTPLHGAVKGEHVDVVRQLLKAGARIDAKGWAALTPLDAARRTKHRAQELVAILQETGRRERKEGPRSI